MYRGRRKPQVSGHGVGQKWACENERAPTVGADNLKEPLCDRIGRKTALLRATLSQPGTAPSSASPPSASMRTGTSASRPTAAAISTIPRPFPAVSRSSRTNGVTKTTPSSPSAARSRHCAGTSTRATRSPTRPGCIASGRPDWAAVNECRTSPDWCCATMLRRRAQSRSSPTTAASCTASWSPCSCRSPHV